MKQDRIYKLRMGLTGKTTSFGYQNSLGTFMKFGQALNVGMLL